MLAGTELYFGTGTSANVLPDSIRAAAVGSASGLTNENARVSFRVVLLEGSDW